MSEQTLPVVVYTPGSELRQPAQLLRGMFRDVLASRELAWRLFVRNITAQYRQSALGYLWAFLPPIATTTVFVFLSSQRILNIGATNIPYPAYVLVGTLLWQTFVEALNAPLHQVNSSKAMLAKINFPREALVLTGLAEVVFNLLIRLLLLAPVYLWLRLYPPATALLAPLGILTLLLAGTALGIVITPLGALYQDIGRGLSIATSFWFFLTPVVYPPPTRWPFSLLTEFNPISPVLLATRDWLTVGSTPHVQGLLIVFAMALPAFFFGWLVYRLAMTHLIERMSA